MSYITVVSVTEVSIMWFILNVAATVWWLSIWNGTWDDASITAALVIGATAMIGIVSYNDKK